MLTSKSELTGTKPNKIKPNISEEETIALTTLIKLQRESIIVIKPCDMLDSLDNAFMIG